MNASSTPNLDELLAKLQRYREEEGTADKDFQIHVISLDGFSVDGCKRLEDKGVTDVIVGFRIPYINGPDTEPLDAKIRNLEMFAERFGVEVLGRDKPMPSATAAESRLSIAASAAIAVIANPGK